VTRSEIFHGMDVSNAPGRSMARRISVAARGGCVVRNERFRRSAGRWSTSYQLVKMSLNDTARIAVAGRNRSSVVLERTRSAGTVRIVLLVDPIRASAEIHH
jgi:hypothetical protein